MQSSLAAHLVGKVFHLLKLRLVHTELVSVLVADTVHDKVRVYVFSVFVGGNQHLKALELGTLLCKLLCNLVGLLWSDILVLMERLYKVLVGSSVRLTPKLFGGLHFLSDCFRLAVLTGEKLLLGLFLFGYIVQNATYPTL